MIRKEKVERRWAFVKALHDQAEEDSCVNAM